MYIPADYRKTPLGSACSGAFAGGFSVIIFQGLDVIKSRMQGLDAAKYTSSIHCLKELIANEGIMALYKGVGPRMTRVCCEVRTHSAPTPLTPPTLPTQLPSHFLFPPRPPLSPHPPLPPHSPRPLRPRAPRALHTFRSLRTHRNHRNLCRWRSP